jgi:uncharacterized repeat protein (TIGR03803 family)
MKTIMKLMHYSNLNARLAVLLSFACLTAPAQDYRILRHFTGSAGDGATPYGALIRSGSMLYGMTYAGGSANSGTAFRIGTNGTGFQLLHSFTNASSDGTLPLGPLLLRDSTLYGMASSIGSGKGGTLFRMDTNGGGFTVMRLFTRPDGTWPYDSLLLSGSTLYGLNTYGGSASGWSGKGTIFQINTIDTNFQVLRTFAGGSADGQSPHGTFYQSGSTLYATTDLGGSSNVGTIFKIDIDNTNFQILHHFTGAPADGANPYSGALVPCGSNLLGMTLGGGSNNCGTIYSINTNGAGFTLLHSFTGGTNGQKPFGSLTLSGSTLYGVTSDEDTGTDGTIFSIMTDGTDYRVLHRFNGTDGRDPWGTLLLHDGSLYGMTSKGGSNNLGVIFALDLPQPSLAITLNNTNVNLSWNTNCPDYTLESTGDLTGTWTSVSGLTGYSATLPVDTTTNRFFRLKK